MTEETRASLEELREQHAAAVLATDNAEQAYRMAVHDAKNAQYRADNLAIVLDSTGASERNARKAYAEALREAGAVETASGPADAPGPAHANHGTAMACPVSGCAQNQRQPDYITGAGIDGHGLTL